MHTIVESQVTAIINPPWPDPTIGGLKPGLVEKFAAAKTDAEKPHTQLALGSSINIQLSDLDMGLVPRGFKISRSSSWTRPWNQSKLKVGLLSTLNTFQKRNHM